MSYRWSSSAPGTATGPRPDCPEDDPSSERAVFWWGVLAAGATVGLAVVRALWWT